MSNKATVSPNPITFGSVEPDTTHTLLVHVTFDSELTAATTVSVGAPFSVSPSQIAAGQKNAFLTLTYPAPNEDQTHSAKLCFDGVAGEVSVTGKVDEGTVTKAVKHLLLAVPDYGDTSFVNAKGVNVSGTDLSSYLRLGSFNYKSESEAAKTLLGMIPQLNVATDPSRDEEYFPDATLAFVSDLKAKVNPKGVIFADDIRKRPQDVGLSTGDDPDHGLTETARRLESQVLYSRGGWRDHSDGNRISTTWGDKVEVVRGNYKMFVLGRQNNPEQAMGWEASGGHIQDAAPGTMPGASYWLEWIDDERYHAPPDPVGDGRKGVWLLVNTTENVYEFARKHRRRLWEIP